MHAPPSPIDEILGKKFRATKKKIIQNNLEKVNILKINIEKLTMGRKIGRPIGQFIVVGADRHFLL